jgi:hypothetical protein
MYSQGHLPYIYSKALHDVSEIGKTLIRKGKSPAVKIREIMLVKRAAVAPEEAKEGHL